ncbi:MAG: TIGR04282 family arsenosugar biosynthesis glycosyltransferase [Burkholderiales bacterium]
MKTTPGDASESKVKSQARTPAFSVAITAKAPLPGFAKTRLIPLLGAAGAARAQRGFILRTLATMAAAGPRSITLWCAPDADQRFFRALGRKRSAEPKPRLARQCAGDIGQRMAWAFAAHADHAALAPRPAPPSHAEPLLLVGTDCPALTVHHIAEVVAALADGADATFVPVEDGGYVLVALRDPGAGTFGIFSGIEWSTRRVMEQTRERLRAAGARWHETAPLWDVDEPADWLRWRASSQIDR